MNTSTEVVGQIPTKTCSHCGTDLELGVNWQKAQARQKKYWCNTCKKADNDSRMFVNGKHISRNHPLYKAGRYKSFDDAAFSGLQNYTRSKEGQVYVITNEAWPEWVKIGMAVDAEDRCNGYQTSSPFRDYIVRYTVSTKDRRKAEALAHKAAEKVAAERRGEWFKMSVGQAKECIQYGL